MDSDRFRKTEVQRRSFNETICDNYRVARAGETGAPNTDFRTDDPFYGRFETGCVRVIDALFTPTVGTHTCSKYYVPHAYVIITPLRWRRVKKCTYTRLITDVVFRFVLNEPYRTVIIIDPPLLGGHDFDICSEIFFSENGFTTIFWLIIFPRYSRLKIKNHFF